VIPFCSNAAPQLDFDLDHARFRPLKPHRAAQLFGFPSSKVRADHRDAQQTALETAALQVCVSTPVRATGAST